MYSIRTRALCLVLAVLLLIPLFALPAAAAGAESPDNYDGSQLWLNYRTISDSALLKEYQAAITSIVVENADQNPTYRHMRNGTVFTPQRPSGAKETIPVSSLEAAKLELLRAAEGLLGKKVPESDKVSADGAVVVGTPASSPLVKSLGLDEVLKELGDEGYLIRSVTLDGHKATVVAANTEIGALYGTYAFIRLVQTKKPVQELDIADKPKVNHRRLNNWDTERLYAGTNQTGEGSSTGGDGSIFCFSSNSNANRLPVILDRYIIFARMCASVGINEITINNVNANYSYLSEEYILMEAALADALRPYGVKIGLSVRYVSPTNRQKAEGILRSYMDEALQRERVDMIFYLLTDIKAQQSKVLWAGEDADKYLRRAFDCQEADGGYILPGVISRKKQFIPPLLAAMQTQEGARFGG